MAIVGENLEAFENRKAEHIALSLDESMQATGKSGLARVRLTHEAFPELDFSDVTTATSIFGSNVPTPLFISSMTAGHVGGVDLNLRMAKLAEQRGWVMAVGSQRRQLTDPAADLEWKNLRRSCPHVRLIGNIGLSQLIKVSPDEVRRLADSLQAVAMIVHTNPLQECLQSEGTPEFAGGLRAVETLVKSIGCPVVVKETGCGMSSSTLKRLAGLGISAVDISGLGGTHWGRVEGGRSRSADPLRASASETFENWGIGTVESLREAVALRADYDVWASGGVRSGLDAAKLLALGAQMVGFAKPIIECAVKSEEALNTKMEQLEFELKVAMFCTGSRSLNDLQTKNMWTIDER